MDENDEQSLSRRMRMQVILDSRFARPAGSAPIKGGKKGEFGDWTNAFDIF